MVGLRFPVLELGFFYGKNRVFYGRIMVLLNLHGRTRFSMVELWFSIVVRGFSMVGLGFFIA